MVRNLNTITVLLTSAFKTKAREDISTAYFPTGTPFEASRTQHYLFRAYKTLNKQITISKYLQKEAWIWCRHAFNCRLAKALRIEEAIRKKFTLQGLHPNAFAISTTRPVLLATILWNSSGSWICRTQSFLAEPVNISGWLRYFERWAHVLLRTTGQESGLSKQSTPTVTTGVTRFAGSTDLKEEGEMLFAVAPGSSSSREDMGRFEVGATAMTEEANRVDLCCCLLLEIPNCAGRLWGRSRQWTSKELLPAKQWDALLSVRLHRSLTPIEIIMALDNWTFIKSFISSCTETRSSSPPSEPKHADLLSGNFGFFPNQLSNFLFPFQRSTSVLRAAWTFATQNSSPKCT